MNYKCLWLIPAILTAAAAYSDVTLLNCPAQFNITQYNLTSDSTVSTMGAFIYGALSSPSNTQQVQSIVVKGDYSALGSLMSSMLSPYLIFASTFLAFYVLTVLCCLFDRSCPPCQCVRRDPESNPYSNRQIRGMVVLVLLCAGGTLIISIVSYSYMPQLKSFMTMTDCSIYLALDTAMNGDGSWGGFTNLKDKVVSITNLLPAAVVQIDDFFRGDSWLLASMQAMQTSNLNIHAKYKASQIASPNPTTTATNINANISAPLIDSVFIKQGMGPNGSSNTMATHIDSGLQTTSKLSNQAYAITQSAALLKSSVSAILNNSLASQNTLQMYNSQLNVSLGEYEAFSQQYLKDYFGKAVTVVQSVLGVVLGSSLIMLLGLVATHAFDVLGCRNMVHLGWTVYGLAYIGLIATAFLLLSLGSVSYNFCTYFNQMLTLQLSYNQLGQTYTQNLFTRMDTCLFGDGNALSKFSLAQEMATVTQLFTNIQTYYDYTNPVSKNYVNPAISIGKISGWMNAINQYKLGIYVDYDSGATSDDNPNYAISSLNLYTYQGGGVPTGSKDVWVWDKTNCSSAQTKYAATDSDGTTLSTTNVTCISFNEKLKTASTTIWSFSDFIKRYVQIRMSYPDAYDKIQFYGQTLIAFRDSRINLFQAIYEDLSILLQNNTNFNTQLSLFNVRLAQFYAAVNALNNLITNSLDGLAVTSNCHSLADKLRFTYNVYCINFMAQVTKLALCSLLMLVLMFVAIVAGCRFGMMYTEVEKLKRPAIPTHSLTDKDITHLQLENAHSTHSDEED